MYKKVNSTLIKLYNGEFYDESFPTENYAKLTDDIAECDKHILLFLKSRPDIFEIYKTLDDLHGEREAEIMDFYLSEGFKLGLLLAFETLGFALPTEKG